MQWGRLLSGDRLGTPSGAAAEASRTGFEKDFDRILFSNAFRRLHDKTQVFPMPANDHIHSRLTHSLEVSSVGRTLGRWAGETIVARHGLAAQGVHPRDVGDIVSTACLAHDIGNPPFGHSGEDSIGRWFRLRFADGGQGPLARRLAELDPAERADLGRFEGNAQGFRVLSRLAMYPDKGGMRLTYATLGAFTKYPQSASAVPSGLYRKHGFFQADRASFEAVAAALGLPELGPQAWARHPLAYLVEAADDICYSILDLEDGYVLHKIAFRDVQDLLGAVAHQRSDPERGSEREQVAFLRARAIQRLIGEVVTVFCDREAELLAGGSRRGLIEDAPSAGAVEAIKAMAAQRCYRAPDVVEVLLAGYEVIGRLLDELLPAVLTPALDRETRDEKLLSLLPAEVQTPGTTYEKILRVTDYVAGMTDRFAVSVYRHIFGAALPR